MWLPSSARGIMLGAEMILRPSRSRVVAGICSGDEVISGVKTLLVTDVGADEWYGAII
jgi:hypothetical protein